jgi:hypothetical protein
MNTQPMPSSPSPSAVSSFTPNSPNKKEVARQAYQLWQQYGCPAGRDEMIWLEAERLVARGGKKQAGSV